MVTVETKTVPNTKDKHIGKRVDDDYATKRFNKEFERW